jgi:hypothetical protein
MPNRSRISEVGVLVSAYRRPISRASSLLTLRRRRPSGLDVLAITSLTPTTETASAGSAILNWFFLSSDVNVR